MQKEHSYPFSVFFRVNAEMQTFLNMLSARQHRSKGQVLRDLVMREARRTGVLEQLNNDPKRAELIAKVNSSYVARAPYISVKPNPE